LNEAPGYARPPPPLKQRSGGGAERRRTPSLLAAALVLALGVAASVALSSAVQRRHDAELEASSVVVANLLAQAIEVKIDDRELSALRRWADLSELQHPDGSIRWQSSAESFLTDHPSFRAIVRIDPRARGSAEAVGTTEERTALREMVDSGGSVNEVVGPIRLANGRVALGVPVVVRAGAQDPRVVFALLEPAVALDPLLERGAEGYSIRVFCRSEELFRATSGKLEPRQDEFWKAANVELSLSPPWTVAVHPTAILGDGVRRDGAVLALIAGLTISALLAVLVHVGQIARSRADSLVRVDADLRDSIGEVERDETEIRELRGALDTRVIERTATLQDTIDELETFNYSVAHDLRSPMGAVISFAAILEHDYGPVLDDVARDYLGRISSSAKGAVELMNGLLAYSQSGREELRVDYTDMRDLVEGVRDDLSATADANAVWIGDMPDAYVDPAMMRRVFTNLISNALKFTQPGVPARVEIFGYEKSGELIYAVRDRGVGFDMRYAAKLFGVFERLHKAHEFEGHGVGLAIVSRLVRRHGGRVWAQGVVGEGATFFFALPSHGRTDVGADGTSAV
jgi:signal transduction histidine kinase